MLIGALQKFSLLDYPGKISAIVFTQGCNFRCKFCYNPILVWPSSAKASAGKPSYLNTIAGKPNDLVAEKEVGKLKYAHGESGGQQKVHPNVEEDDFFVFLSSRAGKLDAVVITGGEPTRQKDLVEFIKKIKGLGFSIKLDTNGSNPEMLSELIKDKLIDYIAMDLKAPIEKYNEVTGVKVDLSKIKKSVKLIMASGLSAHAGLSYEFRTTVVPDLLDKNDIGEIGKIIKGAERWYLQNFRSRGELVDEEFQGKVPYNARQINEMAEIGRQYVKKCEVR